MKTFPTYVPDLRGRLRSGEFLVGSWLTFLDPTVAECLAGSGFDFLIVDGEHASVATDDLVRMTMATRAVGVPVIERIGANEPVRIMHALDAGASGVVVPQVGTAADARRAAAWCRYPPVGSRGVGIRRVGNYGRSTAAYLSLANDLVLCCIQIESRQALDNLHEILAAPGVDAVLVGPNDLAASLGHTGDLEHPDVEAAIGRIVERATAAGVPAGIWTPSVAVTLRRRAQGYRFTTIGTDYGFMSSAADDAVAAAREAIREDGDPAPAGR